jgi:nitroimidazol reductase NimA-like FMN-containing flavoprotein (pyridoxamine 5'-phosphate oxidase superfamily)
MKTRTSINRREIDEIINKCEVCYVGMVDPEGKPYTLGFNFGYDGEYLYLHGAPEGKKLAILANNPYVCIFFSADHLMRIQSEKVACSYSMRYRSAMIHGKAMPVEKDEEKVQVLNQVMAKYAPGREFTYSPPAVRNVKCFKVSIEKIEGRVFGY